MSTRAPIVHSPAFLITGLPGSGNRVVGEVLKRSGAAAYYILHGEEQRWEKTRDHILRILKAWPDADWLAIQPVRHPIAWARSFESKYARPVPRREYALRCRENMTRALVDTGITQIQVSYDALIADPEPVSRELCYLAGLEYREPPKRAKEPWSGAVFDANEKWLTAGAG